MVGPVFQSLDWYKVMLEHIHVKGLDFGDDDDIKLLQEAVDATLCVLTGLWDRQYDLNMRWWSSKPQLGIATALNSIAYCYIFLPCLHCYSSPHLIYQMKSFAHLGVTCLCPSISTYRKRSSSHPGICHICPSIPTSRSSSLYSPGSYCMDLSTYDLLIFDSFKISSKVALR